MEESMRKIELYILEKGLKVSEIEKKMNLSPGSIRINSQRGIPKKYHSDLKMILRNDYGYEDENETSFSKVDRPSSIKPEKEVRRVWNKDFIPRYADNVHRYQDPENGLWKRVIDWQSVWVDKRNEKGEVEKDSSGKTIREKVIKPEWLTETGVIERDQIGEYYIAKNGVKVYTFPKK